MKQFNIKYVIDSNDNEIPLFTWSNKSPFKDIEVIDREVQIVCSEYKLNCKYQKL